jgi:GDP-mannose 4,6-dehydratase
MEITSTEIMPQQKNSIDCGIFMLQTGRYLMGIQRIGSNLTFQQEHIIFYRYLIGPTLMNPEKYAPESVATRKITRAVARISKKMQDVLYLGNIDAKRDWGHAKDYVEAMWLILQQEKPDDYVCATGEMHTVREFVELAFQAIDIKIGWKGQKENEVGFCKSSGDIVVKVDPRYYRPTEVEQLLGNPAKAKEKLKWKHKVSFPELVQEMVMADLALLAAGDFIS